MSPLLNLSQDVLAAKPLLTQRDRDDGGPGGGLAVRKQDDDGPAQAAFSQSPLSHAFRSSTG
jgi:hypothetical protein